MITHKIVERPMYIYPADEWRMVEKRFYPRFLAAIETLFATANGYLGMRGNFEEGAPVSQSGTFINGFYESWPIVYAEDAYGFAKTGQTILNVTDSKIIKLYVDDEPFSLPTANLVSFERALDMKSATLDREILWETPAGRRVSIKSRRLVSFEHRHLAAISYEVTVLNAEAPLVISSEVICSTDIGGGSQFGATDPRRTRTFGHQVLTSKVSYANDRRLMLSHQTRESKMTLACGVEHIFETDCNHTFEAKCNDDNGKVVFSVHAKPGVPIKLIKYMAYHTSRSALAEELCERAERTLSRSAANGFNELLAGQRRYMDDFWARSDVEVRGDPFVQQAIRFNIFQLLQAAGRAEGAGIPAKGLTGQGYEGHYFWDTEIYVLPFWIYTEPRIAKNLLKFRFSFLDKARERARQVNQEGALFPWRTISGDEASAYYAAGTAQYHINADIVYALRKYVHATGDNEFLYKEGAPVLVETARLWRDLGFYSERKGGKFCINGVTGPDEYNTVVNNNSFTNLMARENLWYASETLDWLHKNSPERFAELVHETGLDISEVAEWKRAADNMYVPYEEQAGIHLQDDEFLDKEPWDFENTPLDKYPLLLHHHPLVIYRHRVIKQADVVLAMFLLGDQFSAEQKKRNFDFYDPLTTGDSSLSVSVQAILAAELGYLDKAVPYARYALLMDLADVAGNVKDGCHIASNGGTWMAVVYGLAGMRDYNGRLRFDPIRPTREQRLGFRFSLTVQGQVMEVELNGEKGTVSYTLRKGSELVITHRGEEIRLTEGAPLSRKL